MVQQLKKKKKPNSNRLRFALNPTGQNAKLRTKKIGEDAYSGELGRRRILRGIGGRKLVEEGRHVHESGSLKTLGSIEGPDLRSDPADDEVLEDPSHLCSDLEEQLQTYFSASAI